MICRFEVPSGSRDLLFQRSLKGLAELERRGDWKHRFTPGNHFLSPFE